MQIKWDEEERSLLGWRIVNEVLRGLMGDKMPIGQHQSEDRTGTISLHDLRHPEGPKND